MNNFYIFVYITSILAVLITLILNRFFNKKPAVKYVPAILSFLAGIGFYVKSKYFSTDFEDLAYIVLTLLACIVCFFSFITAYILGIINRNRNNKS